MDPVPMTPPIAPSPVPPPMQPAPMQVIAPHATRWGMLTAVALFAGVIGAGAYFVLNQGPDYADFVPTYTPRPSTSVSPTSTVPADLKTYTNTQYGFEFKYPGNWTLQNELGGMSGNRMSLGPPDPISNQSFDEGFTMLIKSGSIAGLTTAREKLRSPYPGITWQETRTSFGGRDGYDYTSSTQSGYYRKFLILSNNQLYYIDTFGMRPEVISKLELILSTFRFTR